MASKISKMLKYKVIEYIQKNKDSEGWVGLNINIISGELGWCDVSVRNAINELAKNDVIEFKYYTRKGVSGRSRMIRIKKEVDYDDL